MSKIQAIKTKLHELIQRNQFPKGKLPGERELAVRLQVGRNTIRAALQELCDEGLIERHRKTGTIIRNSAGETVKKLAGMIIRTEGDLPEDCYHHLLTEFIAAGYSVQIVSTSPICGRIGKPEEMNKKAIRKLLEYEPEILVVDGYINHRLPLIDEICERKPIVFDFYDSYRERNFSGVWFNYSKAGYLTGKYLIESGCRRPVLFSAFVPPSIRFNPDTYGHHCDKQIIEGFRQAMTEGGIDPENAIISCCSTTPKEHFGLIDQLTSHILRIPDGFCGARDHLTLEFIKSLLANRGRIPENMVLAGIGNTQWSRESAIFPFTSIDLHPELLAQAIVQQAKLSPDKRQDIYIEPTLIKRHNKIPMEQFRTYSTKERIT